MEWMLLPLRRYAEFSGRSRRMEFWMFLVFQILLNIGLYVIMLVLMGGSIAAMMSNRDPASAGMGLAALSGGFMIIGLVYLVISLGLIIPNFAVAVRRLHDIGRSGWWLLAPLLGYVVSAVGFSLSSRALVSGGVVLVLALGVALFVFYLMDSTPGPNRYGPDPKSRIDPRVFA